MGRLAGGCYHITAEGWRGFEEVFSNISSIQSYMENIQSFARSHMVATQALQKTKRKIFSVTSYVTRVNVIIRNSKILPHSHL